MTRHGIITALALALLLGLAAPAAAQSTVSGSLQGTIKDSEGGVLPGVTVTISSNALISGRIVSVTDERGVYRYPSLPPGVYAVEAQLAGFKTVRQENVRVSLGQAHSLNLTMEIATVTDEIMVTAEAPVVSVVANTVSTNLDQDFLARQPLARSFNALMNYAPGVNAMHAYGGTDRVQNGYTLDGVNVANPASGDYWILPSIDWLEEVQVGGLGANAEYGSFTGGVFNAVTKSGGNELSGDLTVYYNDDSFVSNNTDSDTKPEYANNDVSLSVGGPVLRDRIWFFASANRVEDQRTPIGAADSEDRHVRRYLAKMTWQLNDGNRFVLLGDYDGQDTDRRSISAFRLPSATWMQDSPNYTYNASWESLLNESNFIAVKLTGFDGKDDRLPYHGDTPGRYDSTSGYSWGNADDTRRQDYRRQTLDASWNLFADGLLGNDSHSFKFGLVYERARATEDYTRNGGFTYYDRSRNNACGSTAAQRLANYFANPACGLYSADFGDEIHLHGEHTGTALYAQDSMKLASFTINYGVRWGAFQGGFRNGRDDVYDVTTLDPRIGFSWDVLGTGRTALKAHFGRYHSGMFSYLYDREESGGTFTPSYYCDYNSATGQFTVGCSEPSVARARMGDIDHPYVDQWVASFEQQLGREMAIGVDYVHKEFKDIVAMVNVNDDYDNLLAPGNPLGGALPFFDLLSGPDNVLTNPSQAYRDYDSLVLRFDKRYSNGWMLRASLLWADLVGNSVSADGYVGEFEDLNGLTNADGKLSNYSQYEAKISGSVDLPLNLQLSGYYSYRTGEYWTPWVRMRGLYFNDRQAVNMVERGSEQYPDRSLLDLRLAWEAKLAGKLRLGVFFDAFNVLNSDTTLAVNERWGDYYYDYEDHPGNSEWVGSSAFGSVTAIEEPRTLRLGFRLSF